MYKKILLPFIIILFSFNAIAQDWNQVIYLEGDAQYLIEEKEYEKAIDIYKKMFREIPDYPLANYKIGLLYLKTDDQKRRAIDFLQKAAKEASLEFNEKSIRETKAPIDSWLYLGEAYQIDGQIENAETNYNKFKQLISADHKLYKTVVQKLKTCENAKIAINRPVNTRIKNQGTPLNNENSNFAASISGDRQTMIFTSYTRNYIDVYSAKKKGDIWGNPRKITDYVSSKFYLKTASLSYDGTQLFLVTDDVAENEIFVSVKEGSSWTNAKKLGKNINGKKSNETHASVSKDGKTLYFTSDREGGYGGLDIYKSSLDSKGNWGEPENLGPAINTEFDEETPFVTVNDKYLFFSSQGHSSIGGFDIFYIDLESKSQVINLGYPANTTKDDLFFVPDNSLTSGYISQFDKTSAGKNDIYYISILPKINFAGSIKDEKTGEEITVSGSEISISKSESNEIIETANSSNGQFSFDIIPGDYILSINNEGYNAYTKSINIPANYLESKYSYEALLSPIEIIEEELIAEVIEEPVVEPEPVIEEVIPETKEEIIPVEEPVQEVIEEVVEETKEEVIPELVKEVVPEKEIIKYVPTEITGNGNIIKTYSVQLMALRKPVDVNYFENVDNVLLTQYPDGFYRYTVGKTGSYSEARELLNEIHELGHKSAFIRINETVATYTVQIMALIIPVKPDYFINLSSVDVTQGADDYYRYSVGSFNSFIEAKQELKNIKDLGYSEAFVKLK